MASLTVQELADRLREPSSTACFLCSPLPELVYDESEYFLAMLGLGAIVPGYSLVASKEHIPSMLDLEADYVPDLLQFMARVRERLRETFGDATAAEHGRVAVCVAPATARYEPHCLHAHRLVFPGVSTFDVQATAPVFGWRAFPDFSSARAHWTDPAQYLYVEQPNGACHMATATRPLGRQFFRGVIAAQVSSPELADWRRFPRLEVICDALGVLGR